MKNRNADPNQHYHKASGPFASIYACPYCKDFRVRVPKNTRGTGRGYGMRMGSKAVAQVWAHVKEHHKDKLEN